MHDQILPYSLNTSCFRLSVSSRVITAGLASVRKQDLTIFFLLLLLAKCEFRHETFQLSHNVGQMNLQCLVGQVTVRTCSSSILGLPHSYEFKHPILQSLHISFIQPEITGTNLTLRICTCLNIVSIFQYSTCQKFSLH